MSTKIYTGFLFDTTDLRKIRKYLMDFQKELEPVITAGITKWLAERVSDMIDRAEFLGSKKVKEPLYEAKKEFEERVKKIKNTSLRDPSVDWNFSVTVFPLKNKMLGMYFCDNNELEKLWLAKPYVEDYHYQNQTDQPENVSNKEWEQRRKDWDITLPGLGVPCLSGFTMDVVPNHYFITVFRIGAKNVLKCIPSLTDRVKPIAAELVFRDFCRKKRIKEIPKSHEFESYFKYIDWRKTPEGKKAFRLMTQQIKSQFSRLTKKTILGRA